MYRDLEQTGPRATDDLASIEQALVAVWCELLGRSDITTSSDWFELRATPLRAVLLTRAIRQRFGVELPLPVVSRDSRLGDLAWTIASGDFPDHIERLVPLRSGDRPPLLLYVPGAFGEDFHARDFLLRLGHPVSYLRAVGLDEHDGDPLGTVEEMAAAYLRTAMQALPSRGFVLAGYSMGGLVALEMARQGRSIGWAPERIVLLDTFPPSPSAGDGGLAVEDLMTFRLQRVVDRLAQLSPGITPPSCFGEPLTPAKIAEVEAFLHKTRSPELPPGVPWPYFERQLRVYATSLLASYEYQVSPTHRELVHLRSREGQEDDVSWDTVAEIDQTTVLEVDATHSTFWENEETLSALRQLLDDL